MMRMKNIQNIKTCKFLVKPLGQHGLFMVALFLSGQHFQAPVWKNGGDCTCVLWLS